MAQEPGGSSTGPSPTPNLDKFIQDYGAGLKTAPPLGQDNPFYASAVNRVWQTAYPDLVSVPNLPRGARGGDGASHVQMRDAIIKDYLLRWDPPFDINMMNFVHDVDRLDPGSLVPHYQYAMYNSNSYRRSELVEDSEDIVKHWKEQDQAVADESARATFGDPRPLSTQEQLDQNKSELWVKYRSNEPPVIQDSHRAYLDAQEAAGLNFQMIQNDPRYDRGEFSEYKDVSDAIFNSATFVLTHLNRNGNDIVYRGTERANQAVANARIAKINDDMALNRARTIANINLGLEKFEYDIMKGERDFGERLLVDDYMNMIRQENLLETQRDHDMQQRRLLNQNNALQIRQAGQNYADLLHKNAAALATHARGLDKNLLQYGGNLVSGDLEYTPGYEPGGAVEKLFGRHGLPFTPQRTESLVPFQQELPLRSLAQLLGMNQSVHPYATGVPQSEIPGLPYEFPERPEVPDFLPLGMRQQLAQRAEEEGFFGPDIMEPRGDYDDNYEEDEED